MVEKQSDPSQQAITFYALLHGYAMLLTDRRLDDMDLGTAAHRTSCPISGFPACFLV